MRRWARPALVGGAISLFGIALAMHGLPGTPAAASVGSIVEFSGLSGNRVPEAITAGPDGNLWFTESQSGGGIGRITPAGAVTEFSVPTSNSGPFWITRGPDGNLWFTESFGNNIGRITTSGTVTEFGVPTANSGPNQITVGPDGNLWFTEFLGDTIGKISTAGSITEVAHLAAGTGPTGITAGSDGNLWFDEQTANKIGKITPAGVVSDVATLASGSTPGSIAAGPDGNLWFTEFDGNKLAKISTGGVLTEFAVPTAGSQPGTVAVGPDGNLWFTEQTGNKIGQITTAGAITEFGPIPTAASGPGGITAGPDGNMWFTERIGDKIGRLALTTPAACDTTWVGGNGDWAIAANWSGGVPTSNSIACLAAGSYTVTIAGESEVAGMLTVGAGVTLSLQITGCSPASAVLTLSGNVTNAGEIDLANNGDACGGTDQIIIPPGSNLTNTGTIAVLGCCRGDRELTGNVINRGTVNVNFDGYSGVSTGVLHLDGANSVFDNQGTVNILGGMTLDVSAGVSGQNFINDTGGMITSTVSSGNGPGQLEVDGSNTFTEGAGTSTGNPVLINGDGSTLKFSGAGASSFIMRGVNTISGSAIAAGQSVMLQIVNCGPRSAIATLAGSLTNAGEIDLANNGDACGGTDQIIIPPGSSLTNTGAIAVLGCCRGDRELTGNVINRGTVNVNFDGYSGVSTGVLHLDGANSVFDNQGTVNILGGMILDVSGGVSGQNFVNDAGGMVAGTVSSGNGPGQMEVDGNNTFTEGAGITTGTEVVLGGGGTLNFTGSGNSTFGIRGTNIVSGNIAGGQVINVEDRNCGAISAVANLSGDVTNAGTINLTTLNDACGGVSAIVIPAGHVLTNNGAITASNFRGEPQLTGDVVNNGTVTIQGSCNFQGCNSPVTRLNGLAGTFDNHGTLSVGDNASLNNDSETLIPETGGTITLSTAGAYYQGSNATLNAIIDAGPPPAHSSITGGATGPGGVRLAGSLKVTTVGTPAVGSTWPIISGTNRFGQFATYDFGATNYTPLYPPDGVTLLVQAPLVDAPISATGTPVAATEGSPFSGTVATFTDPDAVATASEYSAIIAWGDGSSSAGTITGTGGNFTVSGTHTFAEEGLYVMTVTVSDDASGNTATASGTATVSDAPLTASGATLTSVEGSSTGTVTLATFSDADPGGAASDYTATISWGDGAITTETVTGTGPFSVTGSHTYTEEGTFGISVVISDGVGSRATVVSSATVSDPSVVATGGLTVTGTEGVTALNQAVATFTDPGGTEVVADYTATIAWGDGITTAGTITLDSVTGVFTVSAAHQYAEEGTRSPSVTISHESSAPVTVASSANVGDPAVVLTPLALSGVEGLDTGSVTVATFTDPGGAEAVADYGANIAWGDGSSSAGTITFNSATATFSVAGHHTYLEEGSYTVGVTVTHDSAPAASGQQTATIADALLTAVGAAITGTEGVQFSGRVASFSDADPGENASDYTATIDWGDGSTSVATIAANGAGFDVNGSHRYAEEGQYPISVKISDAGGSVSTAISSAVVGDPSVAASGGLTVIATEGAMSTNQAVATFTDPGGTEAVGDYAATIAWGDGSSSAGTITVDSAGVDTVSGAHRYVEEGTPSISVTISHESSATVTVGSSANVGDPAVILTQLAVSGVEGMDTGSVTVATFTDPGGAEAVADYGASIAWGDGSSSAGTITFDSASATFSVTGHHIYLEEGSYTVGVTVTHDSAPASSGQQTATIADAPLTAVGAAITATEGAQFSGSVASFSDADPGRNASDYTATIDWGDGSTSAATIAANGAGFDVNGSHRYAEEGQYAIAVHIADAGGSTATAPSSAVVGDAALSATGTSFTVKQKTTFTHVVASFTDADPGGIATDYSAVINWGDGATSAGIIAANGAGGFDVMGTHRYATKGTKTVTVTITDAGGSSATARTTIKVGNKGNDDEDDDGDDDGDNHDNDHRQD